MLRVLRRLSKSDSGATAVEYAFVLGVIFLAIVAAVSVLGDRHTAIWTNNSNKVATITPQ